MMNCTPMLVGRARMGWRATPVLCVLVGTLAAAAMAAPLDCATCHREIARSFARTAHANASHVASAESILGLFDAPGNRMNTRKAGVYFLMERGEDGQFYQTGVDGGRRRTERFDLVIGSGRRGQTYLFWRDGLLFQLPVSYHVGMARWINSPGYEDGTVHFGRGIPPMCFGCHATRAELEQAGRTVRYRQQEILLGVGCAKCHGEMPEQHAAGFGKPDGLKTCAACHAGLADERPPEPDVHGDQVGLLRASRCFQKSRGLNCVTCHDVHYVQREPATFNGRCVGCHAAAACTKQPDRAGGCVECHMPLERSKLVEVQAYRSHRIAVHGKKK